MGDHVRTHWHMRGRVIHDPVSDMHVCLLRRILTLMHILQWLKLLPHNLLLNLLAEKSHLDSPFIIDSLLFLSLLLFNLLFVLDPLEKGLVL